MRYASVRRLEVFENPWKDARKFWQPDWPPKTQPISVGMFHGLPSRPCRGSSEEFFQPEPSGILVGCLVERCSEVLAARSGPKTQPISVGMFHGLLADRAGGARKKFFSPNPVEFWLDAWCLPCLQDAMENSTLKLMFVYPLSALPTKLHGEHCAQAYDCFPFVLLCEFGLLLLTCATPV